MGTQSFSVHTQRRRMTRKARRRARKQRLGGPVSHDARFRAGPQIASARRLIKVESESLLTDRERFLINQILFEMVEDGGAIDARLLDYRWHEVKRKCGWNPADRDEPYWRDAKPLNVYGWWCSLDVETREMLAEMSRYAGTRGCARLDICAVSPIR